MNERAAKLARRAGRYQKVLAPDAPLPEVAKRQWDALSHREKASYSRGYRRVVDRAMMARGLAKIPRMLDRTDQLPRGIRVRTERAANRIFHDYDPTLVKFL